MPFTEYVTDAEVLEVLDEQILGKLANTQNKKTWDKKKLERLKKTGTDLFEAHASNVYDVQTELRTDPVPSFAKVHILNIIRYFSYSYNKRHQVPRNVELDYKDTMKILEEWGKAQILDETGVIIVAAGITGTVTYNRTLDDLEFPYDTIAKKLFG